MKQLLFASSLLIVAGCAAGSAPAAPAADAAAAKSPELERLERLTAEQREHMGELQARVALLENEVRLLRSAGPVKPSHTVRIGASRRSQDVLPRAIPVEPRRQKASVPVLRLYGQKSRQQTLEPIPEAPAGVGANLAVVPLPSGAAVAAAGDTAREQYKGALAHVRASRHSEALVALDRFVKDNPEHALADNAVYWKGEVHYAMRAYAAALQDFRAVLSNYPDGNKVPDALLKAAMCQKRLGHSEQAVGYFERVKREYPDSNAAKLASREGSS